MRQSRHGHYSGNHNLQKSNKSGLLKVLHNEYRILCIGKIWIEPEICNQFSGKNIAEYIDVQISFLCQDVVFHLIFRKNSFKGRNPLERRGNFSAFPDILFKSMIQYIRLSGLYCFYTFSQQGWLKQVISICKSNIMPAARANPAFRAVETP
mgnify:CR=1 FL=1